MNLAPQPHPAGQGLTRKAWAAALASILLAILLILQLIGLAAAARGLGVKDMTAQWCSPMFQAALAVLSNCELFPVVLSASQGIGCMALPADDQYRWLKATVGILTVSLVFEAADATTLVLVSATSFWRGTGIAIKRPWFSMLAGNVILVAMLITGVFAASQLHKQVARLVWVFKYEPSVQAASVCLGTLKSHGVRGAIIGWTDGFLRSWGDTYEGSVY